MAEKRIVVVPLPVQGHIPAIINLTVQLASQGLPITLVNIESAHEKLLRNWEFSPEFDIILEQIPFSMEIPKVLDAQAIYHRGALLEAMKDLAQPFEALVSRLNPVCIISDYHATWSTPVAEKLKIPQICFWCGSAAWLLVEQHMPELNSQQFIPVPGDMTGKNRMISLMNLLCLTDDASFHERVISFIPGLEPFKAADLPYYLHEHNIGKSVTRLLNKIPRLGSDKLILMNTFTELEPRELEQLKSTLGTKVMPVGPLLDNKFDHVVSLETEDHSCLEWLNSRPDSSVIYVSFGSLAVLSGEQFRELALGLESHSFLWVIRPEFISAAGSEEFYNEFQERIRKSGSSMIVRWAPQQKVLSHSSVGGFLTHCGWNSTLESLWNGVPMLGWPCNSDQNLNCRLTVEGRGIGRCIPRSNREDVVPKEVVSKSVEELMNCVELKQTAIELKTSARQAVMMNGSSKAKIELLVEQLKKGQLEVGKL